MGTIIAVGYLLAAATSDASAPENFNGADPFPSWSSLQWVELLELEDFENCESWQAKTPSDIGYSQAKKVAGGPRILYGDPNSTSDGLRDDRRDGHGMYYCLGIKEWTYTRGFTWTEITPPQPILIPSGCKAIYMWVCGRNYRHHMEVWVKTKKDNYEYKIDMGSMNFKGWKRMWAYLPDHVPQYQKHVPQFITLYITRFVIRHDPDEPNGVYYCYFDDLDAAVDLLAHKEYYDGSDMINTSGVERFEEDTPTDPQVITDERILMDQERSEYEKMLRKAEEKASGKSSSTSQTGGQ